MSRWRVRISAGTSEAFLTPRPSPRFLSNVPSRNIDGNLSRNPPTLHSSVTRKRVIRTGAASIDFCIEDMDGGDQWTSSEVAYKKGSLLDRDI